MNKFDTYAQRGKTPEQRFWEKVDKSSGPDSCWIWMAGRSPYGYGQFWFNGTNDCAHRIALVLSGATLGDDDVVCHHCDNPPCVNPAHLFVGTHKDNAVDRTRKGRGNPPMGERARAARLKESDVKTFRLLREEGMTISQIAICHGVSRETVGRVLRGLNWKHVS